MKRWPERLWIVRHGQSAGNVARDAADAASHDRIKLDGRDVDIPLSALGQDQSRAVGAWFARMPAEQRPDVVLMSPYLRAQDTARLISECAGLSTSDVISDERLREKEFGILDGLTLSGVAKVYPDQAELRRVLGKFYHRPPGGESWCDVILRLRSLLDTVSLHHAGQRVLIVAHQVVVLCLRYVIESLDEEQILAIDHIGDVANCSVTEYLYDSSGGGDRLELERYNYVVPIDACDIDVTREPDSPKAARG
jgi:probable phosphoglycerate mutase